MRSVRQGVPRPEGLDQARLGPLPREVPLVLEVRQELPQQGPLEAAHGLAPRQVGDVRSVPRGVPGRAHSFQPPPLSQHYLAGQALPVPRVRQDFRVAQLATNPCAHSHGRETLRVPLLLEGLRGRRHSAKARADPHGREALRLLGLPARLQPAGGAARAHSLAPLRLGRGSQHVPLHGLLRGLPLVQRPDPAPHSAQRLEHCQAAAADREYPPDFYRVCF